MHCMANNYQYHKLTVLAPYSLDSLLPLEIIDDSSAVKASFVERYAIDKLSEEWLNACGFYILFSHIREDGSFDAYVGKASNGFHRRLKDHDENRDFWRVALLIRRGTTEGFTTTQSLYLEGRMRQVLASSPNVTVHNVAPTGDKTLPEYDKQMMESIVLSALRIMFLRGYRNSSMGFIADSITADKIQGFEPARTTPTYPIKDNFPIFPDSVSDSVLSEANADDDFWTYDRGQIASFAEVDARFSALRVWRLAVARENSWSAWIVFTDKQLTAIADANPSTLDELSKIQGISPKKVSSYGPDVLKVLGGRTPKVLRFDASEAL
jgi:hypothetical protein